MRRQAGAPQVTAPSTLRYANQPNVPFQPPPQLLLPVHPRLPARRGVRSLNPPLARLAQLEPGAAEQDADVAAEQQRMHDLLQHRSGALLG